MDTILADFLHNFGFIYSNRKFKLFTFSKIFGKIKEKGENFITFKPPNIHIYFSSPVNFTTRSVINRVIKSERLRLYNVNHTLQGNISAFIVSIDVRFPLTTGDAFGNRASTLLPLSKSSCCGFFLLNGQAHGLPHSL